jgi:hypothetical protein
MTPVNLKRLLEVVRGILPTADVRTDQCDMLRVYHAKLFGAIRPHSDGRFEWSVTDLAAEGEISGIAEPPMVKAVASSQDEAARALATELQRLGGQ